MISSLKLIVAVKVFRDDKFHLIPLVSSCFLDYGVNEVEALGQLGVCSTRLVRYVD